MVRKQAIGFYTDSYARPKDIIMDRYAASC
jgi:hypothetical protein